MVVSKKKEMIKHNKVDSQEPNQAIDVSFN